MVHRAEPQLRCENARPSCLGSSRIPLISDVTENTRTSDLLGDILHLCTTLAPPSPCPSVYSWLFLIPDEDEG